MEQNLSIMIVDDERIVRESLFHWFKKYGHLVDTAASGKEALAKLAERHYHILFVDIKMPGMDGLTLMEKVKADDPDAMVVIITAFGSIESAVKAMRMGASDYLLKPFKPGQLSLAMERILYQRKMASKYQYLKGNLEKMTRFDNIIGCSPPMEAVFALIPEVAQSDASVLLTGETGTGKELVAKAIHAKSERSGLPFIAINCGAIPDALLESELFGHQKGAFTGATHARKGFVEVVSGGSLFLDEIGEISPKMQVDLLRVLEEKKVTCVGGREPVLVDFRLISATRQDLEARIREGRFREDFFYRINVIQIPIPPLRERKEDIPLLVDHFLEKFSHETTRRVERIRPGALEFLKRYDWPGNVRELENAVERAVVLSRSPVLDTGDFAFLTPSRMPGAGSGPMSLKAVQKAHILQVLNDHDWNISQAARILDINRVTLHRIIRREQLNRP